jgi:hypothetical protein
MSLQNLLGINLEQITPLKETIRRLLDGAARRGHSRVAEDTQVEPGVTACRSGCAAQYPSTASDARRPRLQNFLG